MSKTFFIYVDYTTEIVPRPYYVGKGLIERVADLQRNELHHATSSSLGQDRKVTYETQAEGDALAREVKLIAELGTYIYASNYNGIGCNKSPGGTGWSGHNDKVTIQCDLTGKELQRFTSLEEAALAVGTNPLSIGRAISGVRKLRAVKGFLWHFEEEEGIRRTPNKRRINTKPVAECDLNGNIVIVHEAISDTAKVLETSRGSLAKLLMSSPDGFVLHGRRWRFLNPQHIVQRERKKPDIDSRKAISTSLKGRTFSTKTRALIAKNRCRPVIMITPTGETRRFSSAKELMQWLGVSKSTTLHILNVRGFYKGNVYQYEDLYLQPNNLK